MERFINNEEVLVYYGLQNLLHKGQIEYIGRKYVKVRFYTPVPTKKGLVEVAKVSPIKLLKYTKEHRVLKRKLQRKFENMVRQIDKRKVEKEVHDGLKELEDEMKDLRVRKEYCQRILSYTEYYPWSIGISFSQRQVHVSIIVNGETTVLPLERSNYYSFWIEDFMMLSNQQVGDESLELESDYMLYLKERIYRPDDGWVYFQDFLTSIKELVSFQLGKEVRKLCICLPEVMMIERYLTSEKKHVIEPFFNKDGSDFYSSMGKNTYSGNEHMFLGFGKCLGLQFGIHRKPFLIKNMCYYCVFHFDESMLYLSVMLFDNDKFSDVRTIVKSQGFDEFTYCIYNYCRQKIEKQHPNVDQESNGYSGELQRLFQYCEVARNRFFNHKTATIQIYQLFDQVDVKIEMTENMYIKLSNSMFNYIIDAIEELKKMIDPTITIDSVLLSGIGSFHKHIHGIIKSKFQDAELCFFQPETVASRGAALFGNSMVQ